MTDDAKKTRKEFLLNIAKNVGKVEIATLLEFDDFDVVNRSEIDTIIVSLYNQVVNLGNTVAFSTGANLANLQEIQAQTELIDKLKQDLIDAKRFAKNLMVSSGQDKKPQFVNTNSKRLFFAGMTCQKMRDKEREKVE